MSAQDAILNTPPENMDRKTQTKSRQKCVKQEPQVKQNQLHIKSLTYLKDSFTAEAWQLQVQSHWTVLTAA